MITEPELISTRRTVYWIDEKGEKHKLAKTFHQLMSNINRTPEGIVKDKAQIMYELNVKASKWAKKVELRKTPVKEKIETGLLWRE